jgi:hypothetical protein
VSCFKWGGGERGKDNRRFFGCGAQDEAVSTFAQDDTSFWVEESRDRKISATADRSPSADSGAGCLRAGAAGVAVDCALLVSGGTVFFLCGDGGQVGDVVLGGHGDGAEEESGEGGVAVEDVGALGVDVEEIECGRWTAGGALGELGFDAAEEELEDGSFKGVEEEGDAGGGGEIEVEGVLQEELGWREGWGGGVVCVGVLPVVKVGLGEGGEVGVELDSDDLAKGEFAGDENGAALTRAEVDEGVVIDGMGWRGGEPVVDEGAEDAGGHAVVCGDMGVVGVAGGEIAGGDEAAGFNAMGGVEGVDGWGGEFAGFD